MSHIVLFDLYAGGHHGQYVRHLVEYWGANDLPGRLSVAAPPGFFEIHADVQRAVDATPGAQAVLLDAPGWTTTGYPSLLRNALAHGRMLRRYLPRLRPDCCVLTYFDHVQLSLATDLRFSFPVRLSGIYFRPSFHYDRFAGIDTGLKDRLQQLRKRTLLAAALRNRHLTHLFCLDPYVVPEVARLGRRVQAVALPDGVAPLPAHRRPAVLRNDWGVEAHRRVLLFFGSIDDRKGIYPTMAALLLLAPERQRRLCLVLVGLIPEAEKARVRTWVQRLRAETEVQVVVEDRFVEEEEIQGIVAAADLVLLPYQRQLGSSGVLIRAALAGVPVLGSDYGLIGERLRRHRLGLAVDSTKPEAIAAGLRQWLAHPDALPFDVEKARRFAAENTAEQFAATIFDALQRRGPA